MVDQDKPRRGRRPTGAGKRKFLATMDPEIIKALKLAAIEDETSASEALENAARQWLLRRQAGNKRS